MRKKNIVASTVFLGALFAPFFVYAQSFEPNWDIGYNWGGNIIVDDGEYEIPLNQDSFSIYSWPADNLTAYGTLFKGTFQNATLVGSHFLLSAVGESVQGGDVFDSLGNYFVVVSRANFDDPSISKIIEWFENGTTTDSFATPPNFWGIIRFRVVDELSQLDPVIIIPGILGSAQKNGEWLIDPIFHIYDDLIDTLDVNGYVPGENLFTFPYDWRQSNIDTALELRDKINEVQAICDCDKVDLVAHSMGGLVARQYIQSDNYENDVDQLIFLGTPHLGSAKSYLLWEGGENDKGVKNWIIKFIFSREGKKLGFSSLYDYIKNWPIISLEQLLPTYDYLRDSSTGVLRSYPDNYPQNIFLEDLNNNLANLLNSGVSVTNIVGDDNQDDTIEFIRVVNSPNPPLWEHGYPEGFNNFFGDNGLERNTGDGTVLITSASFVNRDLNQIGFPHTEMPSQSSGLVFEKFTGIIPDEIIDNFESPNLRLIMFKILSPVDVIVTAPNGEKIGKNFETNGEFNEIENAFYSGFLTDDEFITILDPQEGEYTIETQSTGEGPYTVAIGYITDESTVESDIYGLANLGSEDAFVLSFSTSTEDVITTELPITIESMIEDIENLYSLGLITKTGTKDSLIDNLLAASEKDTSQYVLLGVVNDKIEREKGKIITEEAYNILKQDINWLLNN